jgi:hypothetical protein
MHANEKYLLHEGDLNKTADGNKPRIACGEGMNSLIAYYIAARDAAFAVRVCRRFERAPLPR